MNGIVIGKQNHEIISVKAEEDYLLVSNLKTDREGINEAKQESALQKLQGFKGSIADSRIPEAQAWHGYCLATEEKAFREEITRCNEAMRLQPESSEAYLVLGRIYLLAGRRIAAANVLRHGRTFDKSGEIERLLSRINSLGRRDD